jgi:hypothetical protein
VRARSEYRAHAASAPASVRSYGKSVAPHPAIRTTLAFSEEGIAAKAISAAISECGVAGAGGRQVWP